MSTKKLRKIIICVYLGIMIIFLAIIYRFYFYMQESMSRNMSENQVDVTNQVIEQTELYLRDMDNIALQIMANEEILGGFRQTDDDKNSNWFETHALLKYQMQNALMKINGPKDRTERISVYNGKGDYVSFGVVKENESEIAKTMKKLQVSEIIQDINNTPYSKRQILIHKDLWGDEGNVISVFRVLTDIATGKQYGLVEVQRPVEKLSKTIDILQNDKLKVYILDESGKVVVKTKGKIISEDLSDICKGEDGKKEMDKKLFTWSCGSEYGWKAVVIQSKDNYMESMIDFRNFVIGAVIILSLISVLFLGFIIQKLLHPLQELSDSVNKVNYNNLEIKLENLKGTEVDKINKAFQAMFDRLQVSIDNEVKSSLWAMQAQMNPHFLYNTLSVISAAGIEEDSEKVPYLCEKLSRMLRYSSTYEKRVARCSDELNYVEDYLALMQERYGGKVEYEIFTEGNIEMLELPRISIQPFVENCFKHGVINVEYPWKIKVSVVQKENTWLICVEDNGSGISDEKIEELKNNISKMESEPNQIANLKIGGMGIVNTIIRFKMVCREKVSYEIGKSYLGGCKIMLKGVNLYD